MIVGRHGVLGMDPSLTTPGFAVIDSGVEFAAVIKMKPPKTIGDQFRRLGFLRATVMDLIHSEAPDFVAMERPAVGSAHRSAALYAGQWIGAIYTALNDAGFHDRTLILDATRVKKFMTGNGNASKIEVAMRIYRELGVEVTDDGESDAIAVAYLGWHVVNDVTSGLGYRRDVIDAVRSSM